MGERLNKLKSNFQENVAVKHVKDNKKTYVYCGLSFVTGVALAYFVGQHGSQVTTNTASACSGGTATINNAGRDMITHVHAPKRLSYIVTDGTRYWKTQSAAAAEIGDSVTNVSKHLVHGATLPSGTTLERIGVRS